MNLTMAHVNRRIGDKANKYFASFRRRKLSRDDFTIISNNCWAGSVYRYFGLPYRTPTVGLYFFPDDYIRLVSNLRFYFSLDLEELAFEESVHKGELEKKGQKAVPLGRLGDVEIVFLHYPSFKEAESKWNRRAARVNWSNLFIKFSEMNGCAKEHLIAFDSVPFENKLCLTVSDNPYVRCGVAFSHGNVQNGNITNDTDYFSKGIDIVGWLNSGPCEYNL